MAKKGNVLNPAAGLFSEAPAVSTTQETHHTQDVQHEQDLPIMTLTNTRGRKGQKLPRINMAFTPENHSFITLTSRQQGLSATAYVNKLIDAARVKA